VEWRLWSGDCGVEMEMSKLEVSGFFVDGLGLEMGNWNVESVEIWR
jgi:hypothetical protein